MLTKKDTESFISELEASDKTICVQVKLRHLYAIQSLYNVLKDAPSIEEKAILRRIAERSEQFYNV